jgi:hypothetical protein
VPRGSTSSALQQNGTGRSTVELWHVDWDRRSRSRSSRDVDRFPPTSVVGTAGSRLNRSSSSRDSRGLRDGGADGVAVVCDRLDRVEVGEARTASLAYVPSSSAPSVLERLSLLAVRYRRHDDSSSRRREVRGAATDSTCRRGTWLSSGDGRSASAADDPPVSGGSAKCTRGGSSQST